MALSHAWWQTGVIYQIYPRSFMDGNHDGVGDLRGITSKLDYLRWLGVNALWLSPIYPSPMADFGYDVSNYVDIEPLFGTLDDFDALVRESHARDLKVILDFVPNHTSDEHPWFQEARASKTNEKRDWYIWRDPAPDGGPPNNWTSAFGGPAWQFDALAGQYYLHLFDVKQADLNWRNPEVRKAMYDVMRFWLERGVDGFRVDVISMMIKDDQFRDNPPSPGWKDGDPPYLRQIPLYTDDRPEVHEIVREMRAVVDSYPDRVLIGEIYLPVPKLIQYYGGTLDEAHLPFNFQFVLLPEWNARVIREAVDAYEQALPEGAWPNWVLGNHDKARIATRFGREQARIAQMLLLTLRGTPTCYYGDELAMIDGKIPPELIRDPQGQDHPAYSRDPQRTPMQWDATTHAGFCPPDVEPWLPVADDYKSYNVASEQNDAHSHLTLARSLLALRSSAPALQIGTYQVVDDISADCFVYLRQHSEQRYLVALNCTAEEQVLHLPQFGTAHVALSTHMDREGSIDLAELRLRGNEGYVLELQ